IEIGSGIMDHVPGCIVGIWVLQLVIGCNRDAEVLCGAFRRLFNQQVAPRIVGISIAPELGFSIEDRHAAIDTKVLGRGQTVQGVVSKYLIASLVAIVDDLGYVSVVPDPKIIAV